jgi:CoA:oxalate CoA-transferase
VGNRHPLSAPFGIYRARDGHFALAVLNWRLFQQLAVVMDRPALANDPQNASDESRSANEPELRREIEAWAAGMLVTEVVAALEAAGIPAAPIWNVQQALSSPQAESREILRSFDDPRLPGLRLPTQPVRFAGAAANRTQRAPRLGEHTDLLLGDLLGFAIEKISELRAAGAFGEP